jgi:hypothetical protein
MSGFDKNFIKQIITMLEEKLGRKLTIKEKEVFSMKRSGIAYEMILDYISNDSLPKDKLEAYVTSVLKENV